MNTGRPFENQEPDITKYSSFLHLVDLAGSERQQRTKAQVSSHWNFIQQSRSILILNSYQIFDNILSFFNY